MHAAITLREFQGWLEKPVKAEDLLSDLRPPKHFHAATFENYQPDPRYPTQAEAVEVVRSFCSARQQPLLRRFLRTTDRGSGLYLDGGFGVGKTHLLASAYHAQHGKKSFLSFQELMFLVGLKNLRTTAEIFSKNSLLVIDEFELDDPANTRIATNLLGQLLEKGVRILTSSNTAPGALGEGKFSTEAFQHEIGRLFARFLSVRIEGEDYRAAHGIGSGPRIGWMPLGSPEPRGRGHRLCTDFHQFLEALALAHPIRVRKALSRITSLHLRDVQQISDPHSALRFVYLIDKVYDDDIEFSATSRIPVDSLFSQSIFHGGDTKKYLRAMSRIGELTGRQVAGT